MKFTELNAAQQAKALDTNRYINVEFTEWDDYLRENFASTMNEYGFSDINLLVDVSCTQGSGASFDTDSVCIEKFLRKTRTWTKYRALHEMISINDISCKIERATYPRYVHSNMVGANIEFWQLDLSTKQESLVNELIDQITDFVRSNSDEIHSKIENAMLDLISDEQVKEAIIANDLDFEETDHSVQYV